jgi:hypothetical protein
MNILFMAALENALPLSEATLAQLFSLLRGNYVPQ